MQSSYEILGLPEAAEEAQIRARYLELVRQFPPDKAPERFAEIRAAFDALKNPMAQLDRRLFFLGGQDTLKSLERDIRARLAAMPIPMDVLLSLAEAP